MNEFAERLIPNNYTILGLSLKPFSLGHVFLMQKHGCAFVEGENAQVNVDDLILGLCICSRSHKDFNEFIEDEKSIEWCRKWSEAVKTMTRDRGFTKWYRKLFRLQPRNTEFNLNHECKTFMQYMKAGIKEPRFIREKEQEMVFGEVIPNDPYQNLRHLMIKEFRYNAENVMDVPLASALSDYYKHAEVNGEITILNW